MTTKNKTVKILINIGTIDAHRLGLGHAKLYMEGDIESLPEETADKLIAERKARVYDSATQKEDEQRAESQREALIQSQMPVAEREAALEDAKKEAAQRLKSGPKSTNKTAPAPVEPATPSTIGQNPHSPVKKES